MKKACITAIAFSLVVSVLLITGTQKGTEDILRNINPNAAFIIADFGENLKRVDFYPDPTHSLLHCVIWVKGKEVTHDRCDPIQ